MFKCLTDFEKEYMFKNTAIRISKRNPNDKARLWLSVYDKEDVNKITHNILSFTRSSNSDAVVVSSLKKADSGISDIKDIYVAICEQAIERFTKLAMLKKVSRLTIFTVDPFIQEIMLEKGFCLSKTDSNNINEQSIVGTLTIKN